MFLIVFTSGLLAILVCASAYASYQVVLLVLTTVRRRRGIEGPVTEQSESMPDWMVVALVLVGWTGAETSAYWRAVQEAGGGA